MKGTASKPRGSSRRLRTFASGALFVGWLLGCTATSVVLLARHAVALPAPAKDDPQLASAVAQLRTPDAPAGWAAVHVLYAACRCSQRIVDHLVSSERPAWLSERVLLVGDDGSLSARLREHGFTVVASSPAELRDRYHIEAAPLLVVTDAHGTVRYAGGYTREKQGPDIRDLAIVAELLADAAPETLPTLGCAVSSELRALLNPLGAP